MRCPACECYVDGRASACWRCHARWGADRAVLPRDDDGTRRRWTPRRRRNALVETLITLVVVMALGAGALGLLALFDNQSDDSVADVTHSTRADTKALLTAFQDGRSAMPFSSTDLGFAAEYPTPPVPIEENIVFGGATMTAQGTSAIVDGDTSFRVLRGVAPVNDDGLAALIAVPTDLATSLSGNVVTSRSYPRSSQSAAIDFTVSFSGGAITGRAVLEHSRIFMVLVTAPAEDPPGAARFLDSFRLLPGA